MHPSPTVCALGTNNNNSSNRLLTHYAGSQVTNYYEIIVIILQLLPKCHINLLNISIVKYEYGNNNNNKRPLTPKSMPHANLKPRPPTANAKGKKNLKQNKTLPVTQHRLTPSLHMSWYRARFAVEGLSAACGLG